ncbi:type II toxin-antitoxin system RelE/ParE family toxin [Streptomyces sp. NPDC057555]|uniref:type II toxin-antitoxin system RelE/ParE family toxin n=1 Tax=Streptomyces sp. NPDC057555 TaxID=3346166 RepID=UPI0036A5C77E
MGHHLADDPTSADRVTDALDHLAAEGPSLGRPMVDRIHGSVLHNLKELRPGSSRTSETRMLFVFDAERRAIILVAGDKSGRWAQWYVRNVPLAELRYGQYTDSRKLEDEG